jgi:hypothetical protein
MHTSKRVKKKILLNSLLCKLLGIISEQDFKGIVGDIHSGGK